MSASTNVTSIFSHPNFPPNPTSVSRKISGHMTKTVHPIKSISQIQALHHNLLTKASTAKTPNKALLAYRNWLFFALGINLGFRGGDITELTWGDLLTYNPHTDTYDIRTDENNFIHAEKTGKATYIILNDEAKESIKFYLIATRPLGLIPNLSSPVFASNKSSGTKEAKVTGHIDCDNIGRIIKKAAKEVGITQNICTHSMRKTFGYHYYKNTGDLITLQKIFGHSTPAITLAYIGIEIEELTAAYGNKPDTSIPDLYAYTSNLTNNPIPINTTSPTAKLKVIKSTVTPNAIHTYSPYRYSNAL